MSHRTWSIVAGTILVVFLGLLLRVFIPSFQGGGSPRFGVAILATVVGVVVTFVSVLSTRPERDPAREKRLRDNRRSRVKALERSRQLARSLEAVRR